MSFLNPVDFNELDLITLTAQFVKEYKPLVRIQPLLNTRDTYQIVAIRESYAMDEHTELKENTKGATILKHVETGTLLDIEDVYLDEKDKFWAFFTVNTPELFVRTFNNLG